MSNELNSKREQIESAIANSQPSSDDSEYWRDVAGFKVRIQHRFEIFDLFIKADSQKMGFDVNLEISNIVSRLNDILRSSDEPRRSEYALFFSDGTRAGVALLDSDHNKRVALAQKKQEQRSRMEIMRSDEVQSDQASALTDAEKSELLHLWYENELSSAEDSSDGE